MPVGMMMDVNGKVNGKHHPKGGQEDRTQTSCKETGENPYSLGPVDRGDGKMGSLSSKYQGAGARRNAEGGCYV